MEINNNTIKTKNCILIGKMRHIYEFAYMFDALNLSGYIAVDESDKYKVLLKSLETSFLAQLSVKDVVIVCDINLDYYDSIVEEYGLEWGKNCFSFQELFALLDPYSEKILNNRKIAVWGTGDTERNLIKACAENGYDICIDTYIDNNKSKQGTKYQGCIVRALEEIANIKEYFIIVASIYYCDIKKELDARGLREGEDYLAFSYFLSKPSEMMKEQIRSKTMEGFYCDRPYTWFYYAWFGAYSCCSTWVKYPIGNPAADTPGMCWNSIVAKLYRLSADTRTYCFCKMDACGIMGSGRNKEEKKMDYTVPQKITLGLDYTCNLHCSSCREHVQVSSGDQFRIREKFADDIIDTGWLDMTNELEMSGSGEALFSKIDRKILFSARDGKRNKISLMTNGVLLDAENWNKLRQNYDGIKINISIDAATEKTYNIIRRGGNWNKLMQNMEMLSELKLKGEIDYWEIRMVVQLQNYHEIPAFVEMGKKYHVDKVVFTKLLNWDMYSEEEYIKNALVSKDGQLDARLKEIFEMELLNENIVVKSEFNRYL